jgi:hypothetical protein
MPGRRRARDDEYVEKVDYKIAVTEKGGRDVNRRAYQFYSPFHNAKISTGNKSISNKAFRINNPVRGEEREDVGGKDEGKDGEAEPHSDTEAKKKEEEMLGDKAEIVSMISEETDSEDENLDRYYADDSKKICKRCRKNGHSSAMCPLQFPACHFCLGNHQKKHCKSVLCFLCGSPDHEKNNCKPKVGVRCNRCARKGHRLDQCTFLLKHEDKTINEIFDYLERTKRRIQCRMCGGHDHFVCSQNDNRPKDELAVSFHHDGLFGDAYRIRIEKVLQTDWETVALGRGEGGSRAEIMSLSERGDEADKTPSGKEESVDPRNDEDGLKRKFVGKADKNEASESINTSKAPPKGRFENLYEKTGSDEYDKAPALPNRPQDRRHEGHNQGREHGGPNHPRNGPHRGDWNGKNGPVHYRDDHQSISSQGTHHREDFLARGAPRQDDRRPYRNQQEGGRRAPNNYNGPDNGIYEPEYERAEPHYGRRDEYRDNTGYRSKNQHRDNYRVNDQFYHNQQFDRRGNQNAHNPYDNRQPPVPQSSSHGHNRSQIPPQANQAPSGATKISNQNARPQPPVNHPQHHQPNPPVQSHPKPDHRYPPKQTQPPTNKPAPASDVKYSGQNIEGGLIFFAKSGSERLNVQKRKAKKAKRENEYQDRIAKKASQDFNNDDFDA